MNRRQQWDHPEYGSISVISLEDLILAKLEWSEGRSELQLRDCQSLIAFNRESIDWPYLENWASAIGVRSLLETVSRAA